MNINHYEKIKRFLFCSTQKKNSLITNAGQLAGHGPTSETEQTRKKNPIINCGTNQSEPYFANQNTRRIKTDRTHFVIANFDTGKVALSFNFIICDSNAPFLLGPHKVSYKNK